MLTEQQARTIALGFINNLAKNAGRDYALFEEAVIEKSFAWAFPFNTRKYVATRDFRDMAIGLGPVVVNRRSGAAELAPSALPIERFLKEYEASLTGSR